MQARSRNTTIDIFRLIASFLIITLHVSYGTANILYVAILNLTGRWGVPFFFMVSGYFYQSSSIKSPDTALKKNTVKILTIIIIANLIYLPVGYFTKHILFQWKYVLLGDYLHLWFLPSLLIGFIFIYLFNKLNIKRNLLMVIALLILAIGLLTDAYSFLLRPMNPSMFSFYIRPFLSIPFMLIGSFFLKNNISALKVNSLPWILLATGFLLQITESELISIHTHKVIEISTLLFGIIISSVALFGLSLTINIKNNAAAAIGEKYSLFIYLYHPLIIVLFQQLNYRYYMQGNTTLLFPLIIFAVTLLIGIFTDKYLNRLFLLLNGSVSGLLWKSVNKPA